MGTLWIDEEDFAVAKFEGVFTETWIEPGESRWKVLKGSKLLDVVAASRETAVKHCKQLLSLILLAQSSPPSLNADWVPQEPHSP
jgi:hypothetical protein